MSKDSNENDKFLKEALELSIENRAFEIELLWKRTTIFWGVIAVLFLAVAYAKKSSDIELAFLLSLVGVVFSFIWTLANRGSKAWQESWEIKAAFLFNELYGTDTRTKDIFYRAKEESSSPKILNAQSFSLSKLLITLSDFALIFWVFMSLKLFVCSGISVFSLIVVIIYIVHVWKNTGSTAPAWNGNKPTDNQNLTKKSSWTAKSVTNFAKRRKICAPFYRRLFWRY